MKKIDFTIKKLGTAKINSPLSDIVFEKPDAKLIYSRNPELILEQQKEFGEPFSFEKAGPRNKIYHNPSLITAAILTAGGLCPGINNVIKGIVETAYSSYGIKKIYGIKYGYRGLNPEFRLIPDVLTPEVVDNIQSEGGSILGSSRGPQDINTMVETLISMKISILFCVGGDGTLKCAHQIAEEINRRKLPIGIIGIPKTIDNDISFIDRTFGFETAIYAADRIITCAHNEAKGAYNGVGLVHVMGRDSGFIATFATLSNSDVNYCFIPESPFELEGKDGFLPHLLKRLERKQHAVIIIAEGAGQYFFENKSTEYDSSGNLKHNNIGIFLRDKITAYAKENNFELAIKYFDPTYLIRSIPAHGTDAVFCILLAQHAVHAAMTGCTDMIVGFCNNDFMHVPIELAVSERKKVDTKGALWRGLIEITNQPDFQSDHNSSLK